MKVKFSTRLTAVSVTSGLVLAVTACGPGMSGGGGDDDYPSERIEIVVPYGAGGATDTHARALAEGLSTELGVNVQIVNQPGSGGAIGTSEAAQATPDGYELLFAPASAFTSVPNLQTVSYSEEDFVGIAMMHQQGYGMVAGADDFESLDDLASADGRITYAFTGTGNPTHLAAESFAQETGLEVEGVPFDAATDAIQAVRGGQVDFTIADLNIAGAQVDQDEDLVALAVSTEERQPQMPDVPTFHEEGYMADDVYAARFAMAAPADTPEETISTLREGIGTVLTSDSFSEFSEANYLYPSPYDDPQEWFTEWIPEERDSVATKFEAFGIG